LKIGAFCVLDDKPHEGLTKKEISFMEEMGSAVMSHLDMIKAKVEQKRGTDMVAALGAFTASEASSRRETTTDAERPQVSYDTSASSSLLTIGNLDSSAPAKRPALPRHSSSNRHSSTNRQRQSFGATDHITNIRERSPRGQRPSWFAQNRARSDMSVYNNSAVAEDSTPGECSSDEPKVHSAEQSPNQVMQSASALIQKAVDADGVLFLDASVSGFGNLVSSTFLDQTPDNDVDTATSGTDGHQTSEGEDVTPHVTDADNQPCPILGASYATRTGAVPTPDARRDLYSQLTPRFLRSVLRRSKGAKVWNFNEHGDDYLDEQFTESASDAGPARSGSVTSNASNTRKGRKRSLKHAPGKQLAAAFPGVRSLMVLGLWDPQRNQWRAGCVIWSCTPMRVFSNEGEMHYLTAFCDVIMAKLARLDVDVANNTKSDFISSISHELRSPLHGILGTVEILQEQDVSHETAEMISQIDTCGRTLLDIVDHLLEFSRINVLTKHIGSKPRPNLKDQHPNSGDKKNSDGEASALNADISLDVVTEEVVESAVYSFCCSKDQRTLNDRNVTVSMDIETHPSISWDCKVPIGAWKRVCVNLINNALKYTSEGSINVSLKILPPSNKMSRPVAQLSVVDTGRGMSKDFLRTKLFRAFSQEDDLAEGTGLGMSMVARIVKGWKGKIDVRSSRGQGSVVSVTMPMKLIRRPKSTDLDGSVSPTDVWSDLSVHVMGSPEVDDRNAIAIGRYQQLTAFGKMCSGMGMHTSGPSWQSSDKTDFAVVAEYDLQHLTEMLVSPRINQSTEEKTAITSLRAKPIVVLCRDYISARNMKGSKIEHLVRGRVEYVAQPCGPNRLAAIIRRILERSPSGETWTSRPHSPVSPNTPYDSLTPTPRFDTWRESHTWSGASSPNETETSRRLTLRGRRSSTSNNHQSVSMVPKSDRTAASEPEPEGLGFETPKQKVPEVVDGALTAANLSDLEKQESTKARNQSVVSTAETVVPPPETSKPCLLLVDDNPINLQLLVTYARKNGHAMLKACDGQQAVEAYKTARSDSVTSPQTNVPEVILMDISMPVMDGFEASRHIRAFERKMGLKPVVIIALTGLGSSEAQHEAFVSGINLFLTKPVRLKELTKLLGTIKETFG
jgi:signal transduction histidine kinase/CheY-like chemotaxis protein